MSQTGISQEVLSEKSFTLQCQETDNEGSCKPLEDSLEKEKHATCSDSVEDKEPKEKDIIKTSYEKVSSSKNNTQVRKRKNPSRNNKEVNTEPTERISNNAIKVRGTLFIIGDSHVRHLKDFLREIIHDNINIVDHFQGGASLLHICNYLKQSVSIEDHVFVFGGTNDIDRNSLSTLKPSLLKLLSEYPRVKFTFLLVPLRVHWNREYYQNSSILNFNENLVGFLRELNRASIHIIETNQILHAGHYSRDGIHLNKDGKKAVSSAIATMFLNYYFQNACAENN